ncbi:MAG: thioredoxin family protein [Prochlorococcus sp. SP3034]|nr:thioredoxin family protein [Prochlorococcus sp. SP3034]|tara:strand:+ start:372 stop:668 length:297 start_codon:yes stop_codon:yes gene_type:complete
MDLLIFVRKGCCICDSLKKNLKEINIKNIRIDLTVKEIDIDRFDLYEDKFKKYDYEVPVMAIKEKSSNKIYELPRVSPRLKNSQLENWLQKNINTLKL